MERKILFLILAFVSSVAMAQNWTKETFNEFKNNQDVALVLDLSEATVMDVKMADFPAYYSGKFSSNAKYANMVLEKFKDSFSSFFYKKCKKNSVPVDGARYVVTYKFKSITTEGGFSGEYWVSDGGNISEKLEFSCKDGRWNDFEILLMENVEKFWKSVNGVGKKGNPYKDKLFPKQK